MKLQINPKGVCAKEMSVVLEDGVIREIQILGGCSGNLQGICALVKGRPVKEVIALLKGIQCGMKKTSCPDQLAILLESSQI